MITYLLFILVYVLPYSLNATTTLSIIENTIRTATVRPQEQNRFISLFLENKKQEEAWGLFSYGGYMDDGQITIYKNRHPVRYHIFYVNPQTTSSTHIDGNFTYQKTTTQLAPKTIETFIKQVTIGQDLEHLTYPIFDALSYEYLHLTKKHNGKIITKKRLSMDSPIFSDHPKKQDYIDLITAFKRMASIKKQD